MDPVTNAALIGLAGKAMEVGVNAWKTWLERRGGGMAIGSDGSRYDLSQSGRFLSPDLAPPAAFARGEPVPFEGCFVAADDWAQAYLLAEQPVMVIIEDQDEDSPLDAVVALSMLGATFEGHLFPGQYRLGAYVFLDDDPENWDELDGGALIDFTVVAGEPPFRLEVPIEAAPDPDEDDTAVTLLADSGYLETGGEARYIVELESEVTYSIYVNPDDPEVDLDMYVFDENGNVIDQDSDIDSDAFCTVTPVWTGPFEIVVTCAAGSGDYQITVEV
jgi:hypothetical protein